MLTMLKVSLTKSRFKSGKYDDEYLVRIINAMRERVNFTNDFIEKGSYFFESPSEYDREVVKKRWNEETPLQ